MILNANEVVWMKTNVSGMSLEKIYEALEPLKRTELVFARLGDRVFVEMYA